MTKKKVAFAFSKRLGKKKKIVLIKYKRTSKRVGSIITTSQYLTTNRNLEENSGHWWTVVIVANQFFFGQAVHNAKDSIGIATDLFDSNYQQSQFYQKYSSWFEMRIWTFFSWFFYSNEMQRVVVEKISFDEDKEIPHLTKREIRISFKIHLRRQFQTIDIFKHKVSL